MKFYKLAIGARFTLRGERFTKCGMSLAEDSRRWGHVFLGIIEVEPEGEAMLLSPEEAAKWKPDYGRWTECVERVYGVTGPDEGPSASPSTGHNRRGAAPGPR